VFDHYRTIIADVGRAGFAGHALLSTRQTIFSGQQSRQADAASASTLRFAARGRPKCSPTWPGATPAKRAAQMALRCPSWRADEVFIDHGHRLCFEGSGTNRSSDEIALLTTSINSGCSALPSTAVLQFLRGPLEQCCQLTIRQADNVWGKWLGLISHQNPSPRCRTLRGDLAN
jgi:hypothetical protein